PPRYRSRGRLHAAAPPLQGTAPPLQRTEPRLQGTEPRLQGTDPRLLSTALRAQRRHGLLGRLAGPSVPGRTCSRVNSTGETLDAREVGGGVRVRRGRLLLGESGRAPAAALLAGCVIIVVVLGLLFKGQTQADRFDNAVDSPFITFFAGHKQLLLWL